LFWGFVGGFCACKTGSGSAPKGRPLDPHPHSMLEASSFGKHKRTLWAAGASGTHEPVVLAVRADPDPRDRVRRQFAKGAIVVSHSNTEAVIAALQPAEVK